MIHSYCVVCYYTAALGKLLPKVFVYLLSDLDIIDAHYRYVTLLHMPPLIIGKVYRWSQTLLFKHVVFLYAKCFSTVTIPNMQPTDWTQQIQQLMYQSLKSNLDT
jgi:hypothetical protein